MATNVDPDETARYEPSHPELHCFQRYLFRFTALNGLSGN